MADTARAVQQNDVAIAVLKGIVRRRSLDPTEPNYDGEENDPALLDACLNVIERSTKVMEKSNAGGGRLLRDVAKRIQAEQNRTVGNKANEAQLLDIQESFKEEKQPKNARSTSAALLPSQRDQKKRRVKTAAATQSPSPPSSLLRLDGMPNGNIFKKTYTAKETMLLLAELRDVGSRMGSKVVEGLVANKCIPTNKSQVAARLKKYMESRDLDSVRPWGDAGGRPKIITDEDLRGIAKKRRMMAGGALDQGQFNEDVDAIYNDKLRAARKLARGAKAKKISGWHKKVMFSYMQTLTMEDGSTMQRLQSTFKTGVRVVAEASRMSAMAFAAAVAAVTRIDLLEVPQSYKTSGIDEFFLKPGITMSDWQLVNTDSTKLCITLHKKAGGVVETFALSGQDRSVQSVWSTNSSVSGFQGGSLMVEVFAVISGDGSTAPIALVLSVSEDVLPSDKFPDGIAAIKIPGLAPGSSVDHRNELEGMLYLKRAGSTAAGEESVHIALVKRMNKDIVYPLIAALRKKHIGLNEGDAVPAHAAVMISCDGHDEVLKAVASEEVLTAEVPMQIRRLKHSASRTGAEQPADLCPLFK